MSRSYKKEPFGWVCHTSAGAMKDWKKEQNRKIRRDSLEEIPEGNHYHRKSEIWVSPSDGKMYIDKSWQEKAMRK